MTPSPTHLRAGDIAPSGPAESEPEHADTAKPALAGKTVLVVMPSIPLGGMERANIEILRELRRFGARVVVLTQREHGDAVRSRCEALGCECRPATVHCPRRKPRSLSELGAHLRQWWHFMRVVLGEHRRVDADWIYLTNLSYFWQSWPLVWLLRRRVVFRLPTPPGAPTRTLRSVLERNLWRFIVVPACRRIVCNSYFTLERLRATGARTDEATVIYNMLPVRALEQASDAPALDPSRTNVVYLGRVASAKGVTELVAAATRIVQERDGVDFYIVGDHRWRNPYASALRSRIAALGLERRIVLAGEVEDVPALLDKADLHVLFSHAEAFGLAVLEAKSRGVPSVVSPIGGLRELVRHRIDGYVCEGLDADALYSGLRYFLDDEPARRRASGAALASLRSFDRESIARQWLEVFRED